MILGLLIYFGIIFGDYWYSTHYNKDYINEKNRYMAKAGNIKRMLNNLDELNEDELSDIIRKDIEDFWFKVIIVFAWFCNIIKLSTKDYSG